MEIDQGKWPDTVRPIAIKETGGLGIDVSGRLYWDGKPVEIIGQRLDLTKAQMGIAIAVAVFTGLAALATVVRRRSHMRIGPAKLDGPCLQPAQYRGDKATSRPADDARQYARAWRATADCVVPQRCLPTRSLDRRRELSGRH